MSFHNPIISNFEQYKINSPSLIDQKPGKQLKNINPTHSKSSNHTIKLHLSVPSNFIQMLVPKTLTNAKKIGKTSKANTLV